LITCSVRRFLLLAPLVSLCLPACAPALARVGPRPVTTVTSVTLHNHALKLHLSAPTEPRAILLVYATGDAGWWGKDRALYSQLSGWGYAAVGFSAREYVHHLGKDSLRPREVALDYDAIIRKAEVVLGLPSSTRAVLVGKSRGAGLAVAAAGADALKRELAGVLAVGLTAEEEYVYRLRRARPRQLVMLQTYSYLPQLGAVPVAVIQSTRDHYIPAADARRLFGPDTPTRELVAIDARDHNFNGALDLLYDQMQRSLEWLLRR
jgi:fermentation-respiration switch protein FrsA (DUF1100 family)